MLAWRGSHASNCSRDFSWMIAVSIENREKFDDWFDSGYKCYLPCCGWRKWFAQVRQQVVRSNSTEIPFDLVKVNAEFPMISSRAFWASPQNHKTIVLTLPRIWSIKPSPFLCMKWTLMQMCVGACVCEYVRVYVTANRWGSSIFFVLKEKKLVLAPHSICK